MASKKNERIEVDSKTKAVLEKKGYIVLKRISGGAFGDVFKAESKKREETNAVKVMHLEKVAKKGLDQKFLTREIQALIAVRHPNVLKVHDIFRAAGRLYIFMEFAPGGTLTDKIQKAPGGHLSESKCKFWFRQCVDALKCMHMEHRMVHRDIKPDNVLMDTEGNAKLSDFGFAREFDADDGTLAKTPCGTVPYFAPEILAGRAYDPFKYDVWSMGVMLCQMLNGVKCLPFKVNQTPREAKAVSLKKMKEKRILSNPAVWEKVSDGVKELIDSMFTFMAEDRPDIETVSRHPWLKRK